jgi:hypothetical protein
MVESERKGKVLKVIVMISIVMESYYIGEVAITLRIMKVAKASAKLAFAIK